MRMVRKLLLIVIVMSFGLGGKVSAASKWVVRQTNPSPQGQWTLYDDGSVTRGDPKTDYDQSENCGHGKSDNCGGELDITGWILNGQGGSPYEHYSGSMVEYLNPASTYKAAATPEATTGTIDRVGIFYDLPKGKVTGAVRERISYVREMPNLTGMTRIDHYTASNGTKQEVYFNEGRTASAVVYYDAAGTFVRAITGQEENLNLTQVKAPAYCTGTYGCIK